MTATGDEHPSGPTPAGPPGGRPLTAADELRRRHLRRRVAAGGALLVVVVWAGGLVSSGAQPKHRGPVRAAGAPHSVRGDAALDATVAEYAREQAAVTAALGVAPYITTAGGQTREVALTFDDGPGPFTPRLLGVLERKHVPATFFVVGAELKDFGVYLPRELSDGYVVGDHTQNHAAMAQLSVRDQKAQLLDQAAAIGTLGAPYPHLFRPPYGSFNKATLAIAGRLKMLTVMWTVDTQDYRQPGVGAIVQRAIVGAKPGAIILMHDAGGQRTQTILALPLIVNALRRRGYQLVTVPRLLADNPPQPAQQAPTVTGAG